ncbi:sulfatase-like hydrolase/transferase [Edaphobacter dinghuensis]|uniref:Arylsulfatase n=1 Tax=Edaphobacter dinghuensis TaxID=1560005 RepID=A0A917LXZ6_9BACT|nr:sulfatase-like hydrolase/transferase [Edaphobacter dinghuensis]GGG63177.1 arylsulfatase [Edaphobacter dinghuensis]
MNRRNFFTLTAGAVIGESLLSSEQSQAQQRDRSLKFTRERTGAGPFYRSNDNKPPHILLISADMVSPDFYHPSRPLSQHIHIPNIRSLMQDGTFFSNSFCTVPLCSPSRASYLTGRYSYIQGNSERSPEGLETELRPDDTVFPEYLKAAGYIARQVGKCHVGTKKFLDAFGENDQPWDRWSPPVFDDDDFLAYQRALGVKPQKYLREIVFRMQDRTTPGNSVGGWIVQEDGKPFPLEAQYSYYLGKKMIETIDNLVDNSSADRHPMYLQLDIFDPHQPFSIPAGFEERERELRAVMTLPESYKAAQERDFKRTPNEPEILDLYRRYWGIYDEKQLLDYRIAYALQMEIVDRTIGMVLKRLKELGLYDDMLITFISDHGEMNGRRAMVDKGVYLYPDVLRVPLVIKPPHSLPRKHATVESPVSLLDVSQTLLDFAGLRAEAKFDGTSLVPYLYTEKGSEDRTLLFFGGWHVGVNFACGLQHRMDDGHRYLYSYNCSSRFDELYDLDSVDATNLIDSPPHQNIRKNLIRLLGDALQSDPRWIGYWAEFRIARFSDLPKSKGDMQLFTTSS